MQSGFAIEAISHKSGSGAARSPKRFALESLGIGVASRALQVMGGRASRSSAAFHTCRRARTPGGRRQGCLRYGQGDLFWTTEMTIGRRKCPLPRSVDHIGVVVQLLGVVVR